MKKVLAIILAAVLLTTVALASEAYREGGQYAPGNVIIIESSDFPGDTPDLNTEHYSIRKVTYDAGKTYVDSIELTEDEDEDELIVTLKKNNDMDKYKDVKFTVELRGRSSRIDDVEQTFAFQVGNELYDVSIQKDGYIDGDALKPNAINRFVADSSGWPYGDLLFSPHNDVDIELRVFEDERISYFVDEDANKTVLKNNIDNDAHIEFIDFNNMKFERQATVRFYWPDEDGYIYEISSSGKLTSAGAKWNDDESCWILKTSSLGAFAFSDGKLKASGSASSEPESSSSSSSYQPGDWVPNPSTGSRDGVGVAAALAVMALVCAGALSLKMKK